MKKTDSPLSFRVSKEIKSKVKKQAKSHNMSISQFLIFKIIQEYEHVKQLQNFDKAYEIIDAINITLSNIILDKNDYPYNEFFNDDILNPFYSVKQFADNSDFEQTYYKTKHTRTKKEQISLRLDNNTAKKLNHITKFYNCKKSTIIPLLLSKKDNTNIKSSVLKSFCFQFF